MTTKDLICIVLAFLGLAIIAAAMIWQAYRHAHPKPRALPLCSCPVCRGIRNG